MAQIFALSLAVASLAIGMLGVIGVWLCYLFEAVARGGAPAPPPAPPRAVDDDKSGLKEEELRQMGGVRAADVGHGEEAADCPICLDGIKAGCAVRVLPGCRRAFHRDCIDRWLAVSPRCPICNVWVAPLSPPAKTCLGS